jgi:uncharacterized protein DUF4331
VSHHFDSPTAIEDGRINLTDLYAFPGPGSTTTLILDVNPDAGRSSPTTFRQDAVYEFAIASDGGSVEDRALRITFDEPDPAGRQRMTVRLAVGEDSRTGVTGVMLGTGFTGEVFPLDGGGRAWSGVVADPFWGDGFALAAFNAAVETGEDRSDLFGGDPANVFDARNVTAIVIEIPDGILGGDEIALWARIRLHGHAAPRQVSRMGNPMLRPLFFPAPGPDSEAMNAGSPADDVQSHTARLEEFAANVAHVRGLADPTGHASAVAGAFLPDVLRLRPGEPARYAPGTGNGRGLDDDAFGVALSLLAGRDLGRSSSPHPAHGEFPYLLDADREDRPSLLELFGVRPAADAPVDPKAAA